jgi:hypothetical protein
MFKNAVRALGSLVLAVCLVIGAAFRLDARHNDFLPGIDQTVQYILNLVNTDSGATRSLKGSEGKWTYSMALAEQCTLRMTEELQRTNSAVPSTAAPSVQITNYLIPAADLYFGKLGTRLHLDRQGVMHVIISTKQSTIRRWPGDSAAMPHSAHVEIEAPIRFGKPNVDVFDVTVRLENALKHLAELCRLAAGPDLDPFRPPSVCGSRPQTLIGCQY